LEESQFYEKIKKDSEDSIIYSSHKFAKDFHNFSERTFTNKSAFLEKFALSKTKDKYLYPSLGKFKYLI
jgi:hypothetical protein